MHPKTAITGISSCLPGCRSSLSFISRQDCFRSSLTPMDATTAKSPLPQFYALLIGPIAWAADLGFSYMSVYHACSTGHHYVLYVISLIALIVALTGAFVGWQEFQPVREGSDEGGT